MHKARLRHFLHILEVPLRAVLPERLPILHKDEETEDLQNARRSRDDEAVLIPVRERQALTNRELTWKEFALMLTRDFSPRESHRIRWRRTWYF